jgi:hypothetical protein
MAVAVMMIMRMTVMMMMAAMTMVMVMVMIMRVFDRRLAVAAAADRTHQSTSSSLTRISSPPVTCN